MKWRGSRNFLIKIVKSIPTFHANEEVDFLNFRFQGKTPTETSGEKNKRESKALKERKKGKSFEEERKYLVDAGDKKP